MMVSIVFMLVEFLRVVNSQKTDKAVCNIPFYCPGPFLDSIQRMDVFKDPKRYVDMPTSKPTAQVLEDYAIKIQPKLQNLTSTDVLNFINSNFVDSGTDISNGTLSDFNSNPPLLSKITNTDLKEFTQIVVNKWPEMFKANNFSKICNGCVSSLLPSKYPFIVPGGRFHEFYYFDSFFEMEGLLLSELSLTTKRMIMDMLNFVEVYGFVPNASRVYYLNRSQPPLLIQMMDIYLKKTNDTSFLAENIKTLEKEYQFWITTHSIKVPCNVSNSNCTLTRYYEQFPYPRPESYIEDINVVETIPNLTNEQKGEIYSNICAGAETGWDFSSRWTRLKVNSTVAGSVQTLKTIETSNIIPVDLNSYMYKNEITLSKFHEILQSKANNITESSEHAKLSNFYLNKAKERALIMEDVLWDNEDYQFYDYNLRTNQRVKNFTLASYTPFWANALSQNFTRNLENLLRPFETLNNVFMLIENGLPATNIQSGLQWDYPNSWAPLIYLTVNAVTEATKSINSLTKNTTLDAQTKESVNTISELGYDIADSFIKSAFCSWYRSGGKLSSMESKFNVSSPDTGYLFEKYNVTKLGETGGGGEYQTQRGFGWTNGVILYFINQFTDKIILPTIEECILQSNNV